MDPLLLALLETYRLTLQFGLTARETMSQEHRDRWDELWIKRDEWWQTNLWDKIAAKIAEIGK